MAAWLQRGIPSAGLYAGPAAWFVSHEARYALVPWVCANKLPLIHPVTAAAALISLFGAYLSWRALAAAGSGPEPDSSGAGRPHRFVAAIAIGLSLLFALVILLQGAAAFVLDGCER
jgi:hypothetical protein